VKYTEKPKTLGSRSGRLLAELHERGKTIFSYDDIEAATGLRPKSARSLVLRMVEGGVAARLKPGLFILVPFELGRDREYLGNPYVVARELAGTQDYYVSHVSAMTLHQMVTQPQLIIYASTPKFLRPRTVLGTEFRFVRCRPKDLFGIMDHWVAKTETVRVSDIERTVIDGLKQPEYCGGISDVAKGLWMRKESIDTARLVDYAFKLAVGAVLRRLGFLLELFELGAAKEPERLREKLTATHALLDPSLPPEGRYDGRWRIRLNISPEEILAAART